MNKLNFGVYRPGNCKGHIQTPLSRLHLDGDSNPGPPGRRSRALPQSYIPAPIIIMNRPIVSLHRISAYASR